MPRAISMAKRQAVIDQLVKGVSMTQIASSLGLSYGTVWGLCKRYRESGSDGLKPHYENCGNRQSQYEDLLHRSARCLKTWHRGWGGGRIRGLLKQKYPDKSIPPARTLQRWFKQNGQIKEKTKLPKEDNLWARRVHQVRQVDAKEHLKLANGQKACWLNIEDEYSSGVLDPPVFSLSKDLTGTGPTSTTSAHQTFSNQGYARFY